MGGNIAFGSNVIDLSFNYLTNIDPIINILPTTTTTTTLNDTQTTFTLQLEQLSLWHNEIEIEQVAKRYVLSFLGCRFFL